MIHYIAAAMLLMCQDYGELRSKLSSQFGETVVAYGLSPAGNVTEVWVSPTGSFTVVSRSPTGQGCILAIGREWGFAGDGA